MKLDVKEIGVFGVNLSSGFDQTWITFWRKEDHFSVDFFAMVGDEDPVEEEVVATIDASEAAIEEAIEQAGVEGWAEQYDGSASETIPTLVWTLDIDDLDQNDIAFFSGNEGLPSRAQFDALCNAMRHIVPTFAKGMECLEG